MNVNDWIENAYEQFQAAQALLELGQLKNTAFHSHQTIELAFKAVIMKKTNKLPPRLHSLYELATVCNFPQSSIVKVLDPAYVGTRYPEAGKFSCTTKETEKFVKSEFSTSGKKHWWRSLNHYTVNGKIRVRKPNEAYNEAGLHCRSEKKFLSLFLSKHVVGFHRHC